MNVVILAYGPEPTIRRAVRSARRALGQSVRVTVVAANPLGVVDGVPGAETWPGMGTRSLAHLLEELEGPTLLVHDDVEIHPRGYRRLLDSVDDGLVVAISNDVGTDHFGGPLPPAGKAGDRLAGRLDAIDHVDTWVPACVAGTPLRLSALLLSKPADPNTLIHDPILKVSADGTQAAHDGACRARRLPATPTDGRPLLVASMIVKNEEEMLADCLASLEGLVDRIDVCDTGSTDRTVEIAEEFGAVVKRVEWRNDFGWARNQALEMSRDARFVIYVDADERVECQDPEGLRSWLATYAHEHVALQPKILNMGDEVSDTVRTEFRASRVFTTEGTQFHGAIHESPGWTGDANSSLPTSPLDLVRIRHLGYVERIVAERDKAARNIAIAETDVAEDGGFRSLFHYARSLQLVDADDPRAGEAFERAIEAIDQANDQAAAHTYGNAAHYRLAAGDAEGALDLALMGLERIATDEICALNAAKAAQALGRPEVIVEIAERKLDHDGVRPMFTSDQLQHSFISHLAGALASLGAVDVAYEMASDLLSGDPDAFVHWDQIVSGIAGLGADTVELLAPLAALDASHRWLGPAASTLAPTDTARLCAAVASRTAPGVEVVSTGIMAALVAMDEASAMGLAEYAGSLPTETIDRLMEKAIERGFDRLATTLVA